MDKIPPAPTFTPTGEPLSTVDLKLWQFTWADLDHAIATSERSLKPYLKAKLQRGNSEAS